MKENDILTFEKIRKTFRCNFRQTQLYALYLERFPEAITADMIDLLCNGTGIDKRYAIGGILCELFGLDTDHDEEDRAFYRNYVLPSVRILDAKRYTENPYYNRVRFPDVKLGNWELKHESYAPYRAVICDDIQIYDDFREIAPLGFFEEEFKFPAVLEDGNEWMTLTPVDLDTCDDAIAAASGRVVTFGLGLGYYAYMVSLKPEVESITVIEKSPDVIRLFKKHIFPYFPHKEKVRIIEADAFEYAEREMPREGYDFAFVDTWRDASDGAPMYEKMRALEHLSKGTRFEYWIENFLISRLRYLRYCDIMDAIERGAENAPKSFDEIVRSLDFTR